MNCLPLGLYILDIFRLVILFVHLFSSVLHVSWLVLFWILVVIILSSTFVFPLFVSIIAIIACISPNLFHRFLISFPDDGSMFMSRKARFGGSTQWKLTQNNNTVSLNVLPCPPKASSFSFMFVFTSDSDEVYVTIILSVIVILSIYINFSSSLINPHLYSCM